MSEPTPKKADKAALKAQADAAVAEAEDQPLTVEHDGTTYTIDMSALNDLSVVEDLAELGDGNALVMPRLTKRLIGAEAYAEYRETHTTMDDLRSLFGKIDDALGE